MSKISKISLKLRDYFIFLVYLTYLDSSRFKIYYF